METRKKCTTFSQTRAVRILRKLISRKHFIYFRKQNFLIFQKTEALKNLCYWKYLFEFERIKKDREKVLIF